MKTKKIIALACIGLAFLLVAPTSSAQAEECCYFFNPLFLPFAVAGAALWTAAAIVSAPFYPFTAYYGSSYYAPGPAAYGPGAYRNGSAWVPGHYDRDGAWVPGHWRRSVWIHGHYDRYGAWIPGHWR